MADQMTPAELRAAARKVHVSEPFYAEACRRLAAVIDLCEAELATTDPDGLTPSGQVARGILRAARGDTTNENGRPN